jgi:uncharacterized membrane protein YfcA
MWSSHAVVFAGAFAASVAAGSTGFAFAIIGMAIWLHVMPPVQAVPLVVVCSILLNLVLIWRLREDVSIRRLSPFLMGALVGVPLGISALTLLNASVIRALVGVLLVAYSLFMLTRVQMPVVALSGGRVRILDGAVGMLGGFMGGATSLNGVFPTLWSGLRGWNKRQQRGVFQAYILVVHIYTLLWLGEAGTISKQTLSDVLVCLPALALGGYLGLKLFHAASEQLFRQLILLLFLVSGVMLCV